MSSEGGAPAPAPALRATPVVQTSPTAKPIRKSRLSFKKTAKLSARAKTRSFGARTGSMQFPGSPLTSMRKASAEMQHGQMLVENAKEQRYAMKHSTTNKAQNNAIRQRHWYVGEKITVTKKGRQTGKKGVVERPTWNGRVKVRMAETGTIKSYASHEIRRESYFERLVVVVSIIGLACVPKPMPAIKVDAKNVSDRQAETQHLAQSVTQDAAQQRVAEKAGSKVLMTASLVESRSNTYLLLCVVAFSGAALAILEAELLDSNGGEPHTTTDLLKWAITGTTIAAIWLLYVYYQDGLTLGKSKKVYEHQETLLSTYLAYPMVFEMIIMAIQPIPQVHDTFDVAINRSLEEDIFYTYNWDSVLSVFAMLRIYLLYRGVHYWIGTETETDARMLATLNHVDIGPLFTFKQIMKRFPFLAISVLTILTILMNAYAIRIFEKQHDENFAYIASAMWCITITMTTVGYGDMSPATGVGRFVAIFSTIAGTCLVALLVAAVAEAVTCSNNEEMTQWALYKSRLHIRLQSHAARIIQCVFRVGIARGKLSKASSVEHGHKGFFSTWINKNKGELKENHLQLQRSLSFRRKKDSENRKVHVDTPAANVTSSASSKDLNGFTSESETRINPRKPLSRRNSFLQREEHRPSDELHHARRVESRATVALMREVRTWHAVLQEYWSSKMNQPHGAEAEESSRTMLGQWESLRRILEKQQASRQVWEKRLETKNAAWQEQMQSTIQQLATLIQKQHENSQETNEQFSLTPLGTDPRAGVLELEC